MGSVLSSTTNCIEQTGNYSTTNFGLSEAVAVGKPRPIHCGRRRLCLAFVSAVRYSLPAAKKTSEQAPKYRCLVSTRRSHLPPDP